MLAGGKGKRAARDGTQFESNIRSNTLRADSKCLGVKANLQGCEERTLISEFLSYVLFPSPH